MRGEHEDEHGNPAEDRSHPSEATTEGLARAMPETTAETPPDRAAGPGATPNAVPDLQRRRGTDERRSISTDSLGTT